MQSDFQFGAGEETGLVAPGAAVNEAYLKGLYAGMHFASVSSCWSTPFIGSFSSTPVENVRGLVPYGNLYGFSPEMETHPEMKFQKQEDRNYTGVFDLQKFSNTGARDEEIYPSDGVSVVDFFSPVQMSTLHETNHDSIGARFEQHRLFKSQRQPPATMYYPPLTEPSSSASKSHFKPVKATRRSSPKRPSPYGPYQSSSAASIKEGVRRRRLTDKTRCLQNLIPGGDKMDIGTMLQEAYKYIKFLQAQVIALHSMPLHNIHGGDDVMKYGGLEAVYGGKLGKLNRQQVLQLMVNSPMAQTILYTGGCCIYSVEQLNYLRQVEEKRCLQITSIKQ